MTRYLSRQATHRMALSFLLVTAALCTLAGCAGKGDVIPLNLHAVPQAAAMKSSDGIRVTVTPFDDSILQKGRLGTRSHLWKGQSYFDLAGGKPGDLMAQVVAAYLKKQGWRAEVGRLEDGSNVTVTGKIMEMSVDAKSSFGSTEITVSTKTAVEATNAADGSQVRMTLTAAGSQGVFWFEPEDAQELLSEAVSESLEKLLANIKVENNLVRLK